MQLSQELPAIAVMFLTGIVGYLSMEWFKRRATANGRRKQKLEGLMAAVNNLRKQRPRAVTEAKPAAITAAASVRLPKPPVQKEEEMNPSTSKARAARSRNRKARKARNAAAGLEASSICNSSPAPSESHACTDDNAAEVSSGVRDKQIPRDTKDVVMLETQVTDGLSGSRVREAATVAGPPFHSSLGASEEHGHVCNNFDFEDSAEAMQEKVSHTDVTLKEEEEISEERHDERDEENEEKQEDEQEMDDANDASAEGEGQVTGSTEEVKQPVQVVREQVEQQKDEEEEMPEEQEEKESEVGGEDTVQGAEPDEDGMEADAEVEEEADADVEEFEESEEEPQQGIQSSFFSKEEERRRVLASDWADVEVEDDEWALWNDMNPPALEADTWIKSFELPALATSEQHWEGNKMCGPQSHQAGYGQYEDGWMTPIAPSRWFSDKKGFGKQHRNGGYTSTGHGSQEQRCDDGWMTPFDELIQMPRALASAMLPAPVFAADDAPPPAAVCIWSAGGPGDSKDSPSSTAESCATFGCSSNEVAPFDTVSCEHGKTVAEVFTDGQNVFKSVPSASGQTLFTDGKQLYASVCVVVGPPHAEANKQNRAPGTDSIDEFLARSFEPGLADENPTRERFGIANIGGDIEKIFALDQAAGNISEQPTLTLPDPVPPPCCHPMTAFHYNFLETYDSDGHDA